MKRIALAIHGKLSLIGIDLRKLLSFARGLPRYLKDYRTFKAQNDARTFPFGRSYPVLNERDRDGGTMSGHYFHQDLLIARRVYENMPRRHVDIGSRVDGFVAHCAVFREIELLDIRGIPGSVENIRFRKADLMNVAPEMFSSCDSVSSLHAIEHFGLGRYGDTLNSDGHLIAIENIHKILETDGRFYFSVPIGPQRIEFNAHRVFSIKYLLGILEPLFILERFSYVDDEGALFTNVIIDARRSADNFGCFYGVGIFELRKR